MLLYDRIKEAAIRTARRRELRRLETVLVDRMSSAILYDISSVIPLIDDWERDRGKPLQKRAPHEITWCEWDHDDVGRTIRSEIGGTVIAKNATIKWRMGALIQDDTCDPKSIRADLRPKADAAGWGAALDDAETLTFRVDQFRYFNEIQVDGRRYDFRKSAQTTAQPKEVALAFPSNTFAFRSSGEYIGVVSHEPIKSIYGDAIYSGDVLPPELTFFDLPVYTTNDEGDPNNPMRIVWPPFMAFMLLHCKNVGAEEHVPDPKIQRQVERSGNPPRSTYKTITLYVPEMRKTRGPDPDVPSGIRMRHHVCRGHVKNLRHERFTDPGPYWWPSHWRGDPELGEVITDRILKPNNK